MNRFHHWRQRKALLRSLKAGRFSRRQDSFTLSDALTQGMRSLSGHPGRLMMNCLAVASGIGMLVATIGFAQTASGQITATFDSVANTRIIVQPASVEADPDQSTIPWDAEERATRLNGVQAAGCLSDITALTRSVTSIPINDPEALPRTRLQVTAASPGLLNVIAGQVLQGMFIDSFHNDTAQQVAVLGVRAAQALRVNRVDIMQAIFINGESYTVIGIVDSMLRHPELEYAVIIPQETARQKVGLKSVSELQVIIDIGAGAMVGQQLSYALNPTNPTSLSITVPIVTSVLQDRLSDDINTVFLVLACIAAGIGVLTITVTTSLSIMERKGEIGLRRALGATGGQVIRLLLAESSITGFLGGLLGAASGVCTVVTMAIGNHWTSILDIRLISIAALTGVVLGIAGGLVPAIRASQVEPSVALQEGT